MSMIADKIEKFILDRMREEQEKLILKRNELADELDCAPSQISYVLSTRFSNERGFDVESRRGLGGYIFFHVLFLIFYSQKYLNAYDLVYFLDNK